MPLFDITYNNFWVNPSVEEEKDLIKILKTNCSQRPKVTFKKICRVFDEAIASVRPTKSSNLIWTKTGALFGHSTTRPLADVEYVWDCVKHSVGNSKNCMFLMGNLMRWRISLLPEIWLVYKMKLDERDPETGRNISVSNYWIDDGNFVFSKKLPSDFEDKFLEKYPLTFPQGRKK